MALSAGGGRVSRRGPGLLLATALLALAGAVLAVEPPAGEREAEARRQLEALRAEIARVSAGQRALDGERNAAARELREADRALAQAAAALATLDAALAEEDARLQALQADHDALAAHLDGQRRTLAALLRSAYALGRHQQLKLLLAHEDGARLGRTLAYQRYFQRERLRQIEGLLGQLAELAGLRAQRDEQRQRLAAAHAAQQQAAGELEHQRTLQQERLATIGRRFADGRARLSALGRDEAGLLKLIESLRDIFADIPRQLAGGQALAAQRGRLPRPLAGRLLSGFGGELPDGRRSSGWLIAADAGAEVRAIAHGRVAFADWLKGYGLLLILDHGDGFMSLYAANESLLREAGDWVQAGDPVAAAGSSGGQPRSALYFELRRNGRPIDPAGWLRR